MRRLKQGSLQGGVLSPLLYPGADAPPPSGIRPPADPKGPPFDTFSEIHFWPTDPKIFLKAPLAPIYTNFEGERAPKKRDFFCQNFQKLPENGFSDCFFPKKKKGRQNFGKFFENPPPPRENPRSAPAYIYILATCLSHEKMKRSSLILMTEQP